MNISTKQFYRIKTRGIQTRIFGGEGKHADLYHGLIWVLNFFKCQTWPLFLFILSFSQHNDKYCTKFDYKWKKHRLCPEDLNPGPHDA